MSERLRSARQIQGQAAEQRALQYLLDKGLQALGQNLGSPLGEIDLLMMDRGQWVFIEVRQRTSMLYGGAAASISPAKQQRVRRQAQKIMQMQFGSKAWPAMRFDVIAIEGNVDKGKIDWIPNAF